jgi:hypothetical protein
MQQQEVFLFSDLYTLIAKSSFLHPLEKDFIRLLMSSMASPQITKHISPGA